MSLGEERVRIRASDPQEVIHIKQRIAECINWCEDLKKNPALPTANYYLINQAQLALENGCMWAVKAATLV